MKLYVDIETLPAMSWSDEQIQNHAAQKVPATYKKQESIDKWIEENQNEAWSKTALSWRHGQICAIGYAFDDGPAKCIMGDSTEAVLREFFDTLDRTIERPMWAGTQWVGHNIQFDLTFIHHHTARCMPKHLNKIPFDRWLKSCSDTMLMWQGPGREWTGLGDLAEFLGLGEKSADGSQVLGMWLDGDKEAIASYCMHDVELTRAVFKRLGG